MLFGQCFQTRKFTKTIQLNVGHFTNKTWNICIIYDTKNTTSKSQTF